MAILAQRPDLTVITLSDGAPEMRTLLRTTLNDETLGTPVYELLDLWHVLEKLAPAAQVVFGEASVKTVVARWRLNLLNRTAAPDDIFSELIRSGRRRVRVSQQQPVHEAITYLENIASSWAIPVLGGAGSPSAVGPPRRRVKASCRPHEAKRRALEGRHPAT